MNVITTFKEKKVQKQLSYERKMLREISLEDLKNNINHNFGSYLRSKTLFVSSIEEGCMDIAIEAFLLGARYSRFGYYGESVESVKQRSYYDEKYLIDNLYDFITYWTHAGDYDMVSEGLYYTCEHYVGTWWNEGFIKGEKRYRLKLH
ncbi:YbaK family protein [Litchfieldia salsa]|uniref:DUF2521 family protein n=1 Tax=Litchfieldia salsa TaxID=930152 RepID=A0A1H0WU54_9BACI|nr:YbaK family protein [Litchfieldia salsa]SDP94217.1 Protein of unknown function [Litchfieldia salsa]